MRWLLFLARVAFICNIFFILCIIIQYTHDFIKVEFIKAIVIILGLFVSFFVNIIVNTAEMVLLVSRKPSLTSNPLRVFNLSLFLLQLIAFFFIQYDIFNS